MTLYEERMSTLIPKISSTRVPTPLEHTASRVVLFIFIIFLIAWRLYATGDRDALMLAIRMIVGVATIMLIHRAVRLTKVTVTDTEVTVKRTIGSRTVRTDDVVKVSIEAADIKKGMYVYNAAHPGARIYASKGAEKGVAFELRDGTSMLVCSKTPDAFKAAVMLALGKRKNG